MAEEKGGRELAPREPSEVETTDGSLTPTPGESRDVERFSAGPRAHSVSLTEERSAQIVRQSANARNIVFLAILLIALFIPVYWFYESGIPALGTEGRMTAELEQQYVTDVARGYELYLANCAECHGDNGQGGIGPRLNDQGKLYNVLTPAGDAGTGHLNPAYLHNVLNVGGRYVCGDPDSLMQAWQLPAGPLNYRQVEELIAWITASQDVVFERRIETHGADAEVHEPEVVSGWRDPNYEPGPEDTPVPACWKAPGGLVPGTVDTTGTTPATDGDTTVFVEGGTPENPRVVEITATASLQFLGENDAPLTQIDVVPGETIEFVVDNGAGFDHNFYIGTADELQVPFGETAVGIPTWSSGQQTLIWTVPDTGVADLQFACTVPGHYQPMHGTIEFSGGEPAADTTPADDGAAQATPADGGGSVAAGGTPDAPRQIDLEATSSLQFTDPAGAQVTQIEVIPGETIEFSVDNTAGFDHDFWIGTAEELQGGFAETDVGIPVWQNGVQTVTWTVPEEGADGLQFACTVPGHYQPMHGTFVIADGAPAGDGAQAPAADTPAQEDPAEEGAPAGGAAAAGGTPDQPRVVNLSATASLQFVGEDGSVVNSIGVVPGETIEFVVDNTAGFDHDFWIGTAEELQGGFAETDVGIPVWQNGVQTVTWTVPEEGAEVLQFACTVPGHYQPMHGNFVIQG